MKRSVLVLTIVLALIACGPSQAQQPKPGAGAPAIAAADKNAPKLSEQAKLELRLAAVTAENLQLKAQALAMEFNKAQQAFQALIAKHTPAGYVIDNDLNLVKAPAPEKK